MRFLLDENFPIQLQQRLLAAGHLADHIIALGQRGMPDSQIRQRLVQEPDLVFVTQDTEFEELALVTTAGGPSPCVTRRPSGFTTSAGRCTGWSLGRLSGHRVHDVERDALGAQRILEARRAH